MKYHAHFFGGHSAPITPSGSFGRQEIVGLLALPDGRRHVIFFEGKTGRLTQADQWVTSVELIERDVIDWKPSRLGRLSLQQTEAS